jgi:predicted O-methyltransferase YrrM
MNPLPTYVESAVQAIFADHNLVNIQQHEWEMRTFLAMVLEELKPERTVELGTYKGFTSALLSLVTSRHTVSIDPTDYGTAEARHYGHQLDFIAGDAAEKDSLILAMASLGGPIDLLFIDDGHYYETICTEFRLWAPYVRNGGWIVFHDINPLANIGPHGVQPPELQVTRFWNELQGNKQEIIATEEHKAFKGTLPHGGLGILRV